MDKFNGWEVYVGSAVIFGVGVVTGAVLRKLFLKVNPGNPSSYGSYYPPDSFAKATRIASLRARNLGRNHKMVFVVRSDLAMGKGKIAAQCSHAAVMCFERAQFSDIENLELWQATGQTKICLKCDGGQEELKSLEKKAKEVGIVSALVRDAGYTQIEAGTTTVLGLGPAPVTKIDEITSHLKLL